MPVLGLPLLLAGLGAIPLLAGIYWLRTRYRRQAVSTLFLWQTVVEAQGGGRKKSRLQTPLALLLELLVILLLVLAAAAPRVRWAGQTIALTVVLDDSYSMQAIDDGVTVQQRAIDALRQELGALPQYKVRLIAAGTQPRLLGPPASDWATIERTLADWRCEASFADITGALVLASEMGGPRQRLLVLSDHEQTATVERNDLDTPPTEDSPVLTNGQTAPESDVITTSQTDGRRLRWIAVGRPSGNVALVNAVRSTDADQQDTILIELVNHGQTEIAPTMTLSAGQLNREASASEPVALFEEPTVLERRTVVLAPGQNKRLWLKPTGMADRPLHVSIDDDALLADNDAILMPVTRQALDVAIQIQDPELNQAVRRAVLASGRARITSGRAALLFTDAADSTAETQADSLADWTVRFVVPDQSDQQTKPQAYLGPFVIDYDHPLSQGLSLTGLVWSVAEADSDGPSPANQSSLRLGQPIITAGNDVLLAEAWRQGDRREINWRLWPERSTLLQSAAFPILIWNAIEWRQAQQPGITPVNVRPGVPIAIKTAQASDQVRVQRVLALDGSPMTDVSAADEIALVDRQAAFSPSHPGVYTVQTPGKQHLFAVHGGSLGESDLHQARTTKSGQWDDTTAIEREYQGLGWLLGLLALGGLGAHAVWLSRGGTR